jgi:nitrogen regulatory protein PII
VRRVEIITEPSKLDGTKDALMEIGIDQITMLEIRRIGINLRGQTEFYRGKEYVVRLLPAVTLMFVVRQKEVPVAIGLIGNLWSPSPVCDVIVTDVSEVVRIRTGERGGSAL